MHGVLSNAAYRMSLHGPRVELEGVFKHLFNTNTLTPFSYKFSPEPLIGGIHKDRATTKQSLLR